MGSDRTRNPRGTTPASLDPGLGELEYEASRTLVEELGEVADDLRQIGVEMGLHPYTVHVVRIRWSGSEQGRGKPTTVLDRPLQPTPTISSINVLDRLQDSAGVVERGDIRMTGVSPRYTEDELDGYFGKEDDEEAFYEVRIDKRDGTTKRRRFVLSNAPERRPGNFDWSLTLTSQDDARERSGARRSKREKAW